MYKTMTRWLLLTVSVLLPSTAVAQSREAITAAARDVMQKARYCALITVGDDGQRQARIVDPLAPDDRFAIWIATNPLTRKVNQIRGNARVTLFYFDAATSSYVTVLGRARLVTDASERERHWKAEWTPIYDRPEGTMPFVLIAVAPERLEIVSSTRGMRSDPNTWRPLSIDLQ